LFFYKEVFVRKIVLLASIMVGAALYASHAEAWSTAGVFHLPFNSTQSWTACPEKGYKPEPDQHFLDLNTTYQKYHTAEDWNGKCGGSTDKGGPLYAIADGSVVFAEPIPSVASIGKILIVRYTLPDGTQIDSVYYHIESIYVKTGQSVALGSLVATIGDGSSFYAGSAHLHWEMRTDLLLDPHKNPYYQPLTIPDALHYRSPSLFVDDRSLRLQTNLTKGAWTYFSTSKYAPSSTAYIEILNSRLSLRKASDLGVIHNLIYIYQNGWVPYTNITDVFFEPGKSYAIWSYQSEATMNILPPGDHYRKDRAIQDMITKASEDTRLISILSETYGENLAWDSNYELRWVDFTTSKGTTPTRIYQATNKTNPLLRYVQYPDPETHTWPGWHAINKNKLQ
jgi:murein DD-endopeptidase MepM/ murein hydrolase activator NlpD